MRSCRFCGAAIGWSRNEGSWRPTNQDGTAHVCSTPEARAEVEERRGEIAWARANRSPHPCGDTVDGPLCDQNLDGTCNRESCTYFGIAA